GGTGHLKIQATNLKLQDVDGNNYIDCIDGSYVRLMHNADTKLETTSTGIAVTGRIETTAAAGNHTVFNSTGADADFRVRTGANTHSFYVEGNTGNIGLGTSLPNTTTKLHISVPQSGVASGTGITLSGWNGTAESRVQLMSFGIGDGTFAIRTGTSNSERMRIDSS
ncbi:MAG TPA: hypothetical protein DCM40_35875, partial [Maribacter sp.]|nr:hypothetical protein [Maribacter sp.]